jgi:hypothetical protein
MHLPPSAALASLVLISSAGWALAASDSLPPAPLDTPMTMRALEAVCTGIGEDSRNDPRWAAYPLKIEVVGRGGQFLGDTVVTVEKDDEALASINCGGPWVLVKLMPGSYSVKADVEGVSKTARVTVTGKEQTRVVLRFEDAGGAVSPEYVPPK